MAKYILPAFLNVNVGGREGYVAVEKVLADPDLRGQVIAKSLAELEAWARKWRAFLTYAAEHHQDEAAPFALAVVSAFDFVQEKMGDKWPTMPDEDDETITDN